MHDETVPWHSNCMRADILAMQEACRSYTAVGQEDPECVNWDTNGVTGVRCMVMRDCVACNVMCTCMV